MTCFSRLKIKFEQTVIFSWFQDGNERVTATSIRNAAVVEKGRKWRIDMSNESNRLNIPHGVQVFRVSIEDSVLMNNTRNILKVMEKRSAFSTMNNFSSSNKIILEIEKFLFFLALLLCKSYQVLLI